jgi:hypothetical protein
LEFCRKTEGVFVVKIVAERTGAQLLLLSIERERERETFWRMSGS